MARCWTLWVDLDVHDALQRIETFRPCPSLVLLTGTGGHAQALWPLREPIARHDVARANRRLAHVLGGDKAAIDVARILRAPTSFNHKTDPPVAVACVRVELTMFTAREVVGHLADPPAPNRRAHATTRMHDTDDDVLKQLPASEYVPLLLGRELDRDGKTACPFHDDRTPSLHAYSTAERGWICFGCKRAGTIIDFASYLYGIEPRGRGFHEIRQRLAADLLAAIDVAA